ncbi:uncharacterized protein [Primulina huaijiensis]|uniref:uncharacterized protein n=1 Tax=Primulina huaijiensis TaxID=1492673 RepID=UPI003CC736C3
MVSPRGPKDVQQLTGRIAVLARFISRSAHRSLPFFRVLRKAKKFEWGPDCEKAFEKLKKYLAELLVLVKPAAGEPLWVYLYADKAFETFDNADEAFETILLSHPIVVLTNSLLGRILTHSNTSGRLVKWTTELGEYDIHYEPRTAIKAQDLADFQAEIMHQETGDEVKLAIRLDFRASNIEAEYEVVLAGLQADVNVGATRVLVFSDSQLVAQQMKGVYDVKDEKIIEHAQEVDRVRGKFAKVAFKQIPRKENEKTDI